MNRHRHGFPSSVSMSLVQEHTANVKISVDCLIPIVISAHPDFLLEYMIVVPFDG